VTKVKGTGAGVLVEGIKCGAYTVWYDAREGSKNMSEGR